MPIEVSRTKITNIFLQADSNNDLALTEKEIRLAEKDGCITEDEAALLRQAYGFQKNPLTKRHFDQDSESMKLWEYMQVAGALAHENIFKRSDVIAAKENAEVAANNMTIYALLRSDPSTFGKTKEFMLDAVKENGLALEFASDQLRDDPELVLAAISQDARALCAASDRLRKDKAFILQAVKVRGDAVLYADRSLYGDAEILIAAAPGTYGILAIASQELLDNRAFVRLIVKLNWAELGNAPQRFKKDEDIALLAIGQFGEAYSLIDDSLKSDPMFNQKAFHLNFNVYPHMQDPPLSFKTSYDTLVNRLGELDITHPNRFNTASAKEIIKNRARVGKPDGRPLAVVVYPKSDWNGAFTQNTHFDSLIRDGYRVVYYEAGTEDAFYAAVREAGGPQKINLLIAGAHGMKEVADLNYDERFPDEDETRVLDCSDGLELARLREYFAYGCLIVLESCSTGQGGPFAVNLANTFALATGQKVIAPTRPTYSRKYLTEQRVFNGKTYDSVVDVEFECGRYNTYIGDSKRIGGEVARFLFMYAVEAEKSKKK